MSSIEVRRFRRSDREQVTALVAGHAAAVVPGVSVSVNTVLSQLERDPGEFIVGPWVSERATFVAEQRGRVVAAAHLLRYRADEGVGESYRDAGEIRWFLCWPDAPYWPDSQEAGDVLIAACIAQLGRWGVRSTYERAGFAHTGHTEIVYLAVLDDLRRPGDPPLPRLAGRRSLGINGTRLSAVLGAEVVGYIEVDGLDEPVRLPRQSGWADVGNLHVAKGHRRRGIGTWLVAQAAEGLSLGHVDRVLDYAWPDQEDCTAFLHSVGFRELTRTARGWVRNADA